MGYVREVGRGVAVRRESDTTEWRRSIGRCDPSGAKPTPRSGVAPGSSGVAPLDGVSPIRACPTSRSGVAPGAVRRVSAWGAVAGLLRMWGVKGNRATFCGT